MLEDDGLEKTHDVYTILTSLCWDFSTVKGKEKDEKRRERVL